MFSVWEGVGLTYGGPYGRASSVIESATLTSLPMQILDGIQI